MKDKIIFNELTRVQIPSLIHLTRLGYKYLSLKNLSIDKDTGILTEIFEKQFNKFNPNSDFKNELKNIKSELDQDDLGHSFYNRLISGKNKLIDFNKPENNIWQIAAEVEHERNDERFRPDITVFVNGLPLVFVELKQPNSIRNGFTGIKSEAKRTVSRLQKKAFRRFNNITQIMIYSDNMPYDNTIDQLQGSYYTTPSIRGMYFNSFKEQEESVFNVEYAKDEQINYILKDLNKQVIKNSNEFQTNLGMFTPTNKILSSLLTKNRLLFFIQYGIVYVNDKLNSDGTLNIRKNIMRYPQFFATKAIKHNLMNGIKRGIIWHTQGSGKTALAYHNIRYLRDFYQSQSIIPHFYFIVDRLELANQTAEEFIKRGLNVKMVSSSNELNKPFTQDVAVVNIQKFKDITDFTNKSGYILREQNVYFIDEAHRSYNPRGSYLANLYNSDVNSIKIALTGTPLIAPKKFDYDGKKVIENADLKTTKNIFGDYIHKYYYNESISDGFTLRLIHEDIETQYKVNMKNQFNKIKIKLGVLNKKSIYAHPKFVSPMLEYILNDFKAFQITQGDTTVGAMVVSNSSEQAKELFKQFNEKKGSSYGFKAALVLYDQENNLDKVRDFKSGKIDILFVYSMLLTGFDSPRLKKLYLGRKIKAHNLLQTLTRVNRPYKQYKQGYVVDFANISKEFDETNNAYLKELNNEYDPEITGESKENVFGSLFVNTDEINKNIKFANKIIINYPTDNLEIFSQSISDINDHKTLNNLKSALISIKDNFQMARLLNYDAITKKINPVLITKMLNMTTQRIATINQLENANDTSGYELLNLVMSDSDFVFVKTGEHELQLADNNLQDTKKKAAKCLQENHDKKDPKFISLLDEFKRILSKQNAAENKNLSMIKTTNNEYKLLINQVKELNKKNKQLANNFSGDYKYARIAKRLKLKKPSNNMDLYNILKLSKERVDDLISNNESIIENEDFFEGKTKEIIGRIWRNINNKDNISPSILLRLSELTVKEYLNEFEGAF